MINDRASAAFAGVPGSIPGWGVCDFFRSAKASLTISLSLSPFPSSSSPFPSPSDLSFALKNALIPLTFLDFVEWVSQKESTVIEAKKTAFNLSDLSKQQNREYWGRQSKAPMDKFGTAMHSRNALYQNTIQDSLEAESSDGNHSWPGNATSSDFWRFCIA